MIRTVTVAAAASAVAAGLWLTAAPDAAAHGGATGIVKERMDLMKAMGDSMKTLTAMMQGKAPYDADTVRREAQAIAERGGDDLVTLFPEGTAHDPSEALPAIWNKPDRFKALAEDLTTYAEALAKAADNGTGSGMGAPSTDMNAMMGGASTQEMMGAGSGGMGAMMGGGSGPSPEALADMPPQAAFMQLSNTCGACHDSYRMKKD
ncbi:c-type cytochrome [Caenispirillum salinarum]|uniref:c-type cytochrome n=1 Tax=Caenispirillum salinarum TaxID=859058 RepID=UPI00384D1E07